MKGKDDKPRKQSDHTAAIVHSPDQPAQRKGSQEIRVFSCKEDYRSKNKKIRSLG